MSDWRSESRSERLQNFLRMSDEDFQHLSDLIFTRIKQIYTHLRKGILSCHSHISDELLASDEKFLDISLKNCSVKRKSEETQKRKKRRRKKNSVRLLSNILFFNLFLKIWSNYHIAILDCSRARIQLPFKFVLALRIQSKIIQELD